MAGDGPSPGDADGPDRLDVAGGGGGAVVSLSGGGRGRWSVLGRLFTMTLFDSRLSTFGADFGNLNMGVAEKLVRSVAIYVLLVVALRIFGKRE